MDECDFQWAECYRMNGQELITTELHGEDIVTLQVM